MALGLVLPAAADEGAAGAPLEVSVKTVSDDALRGRLISLSLDNGAVLRAPGDRDQVIPVADLVRITTTAAVAADPRQEARFGLDNGDVLYGRPTGAREDAVIVDTVDLGSVAVPLDAIRRIDTEKALQAGYRESAAWFDRAGRADDDRMLLTNGDTIHGFITAIDADGVSIDGALGETTVPHRLVVAVRMAGPTPPTPDRPHLILHLRSSGKLTVTDLDWSGNVVDARLRDGQRVPIEAERITRVDVVGGRWEWLSTHRPISYQHTPMLTLGWEYADDRNVLGGPLRVAGQTFDRGVGVHSRSSLTYDLGGAYRDFVTGFGMDDDSGPYADVAVRILVDGKRRFEQSGIGRGTLHGPIRLDVTKANRIELITDFGENGDLQDRFDWIEPALIGP